VRTAPMFLIRMFVFVVVAVTTFLLALLGGCP
jgi:hypothetical protein